METRRMILYAALGMLIYFLYNAWQQDFRSEPTTSYTAVVSNHQAVDSQLLPQTVTGDKQAVPLTEVATGKLVRVKTDVLDLDIDLQHGNIINAKLLQYPVNVDSPDQPFTLLMDSNGEKYTAESSLFVLDAANNIVIPDFAFQSDKPEYTLNANDDTLVVKLVGKNADGLAVTKQYTLTRGKYVINLDYTVENHGLTPWKGYFHTRFLQDSPQEDKSSLFHAGSYTGASYSDPNGKHYRKISYKDMSKHNLDQEVKGGWIAMQQHYFLSAFIPETGTVNKFYTRTHRNNYVIGSVSEPLTLAPQATARIGSRLYLGPEIGSELKAIAPYLDLTIDYGILWFLSSLLFAVMKAIYNVIGNWGWAIVLVTVLVKLAFYRLSATSYKSMAGMRNLQPKLQALRDRYGDDKAAMSQATMELYRKEKVNPLGGCLPILIQIPVFIALYWVLLESVELRQAPFMFWIKDLAVPDPWHVLPIIMGFTMLIQQRLNPAPPDPMQAKVMMLLPIFFTALFWSFPAGLVLYWVVNNVLSILQQWYITRKYGTPAPLVAANDKG